MAAMVGCGRPRPHGGGYDLSRSEMLLELGDTLLRHADDNDAGAGLEARLQANGASRQDEAIRELERQHRRQKRQRKLLMQAQQLLEQGRYNQLADSIDEAELRGEVTVRLLALRDLPQALLALKLYCARQPYQKSADVAQAQEMLRPYFPVLETSAAFREFQAAQRRLQAELLAQERRRAAADISSRLDLAIAEGDARQAGILLNQLRAAAPEAPLLQYLDGDHAGAALERLLREGAIPPEVLDAPERLTALELALALCRPRQDAARQAAADRLLAAIPQTATISGTALKGACLKDVTLLEAAIGRWYRLPEDTARGERAPAFLPAYLALCRLGGDTAQRMPLGAGANLPATLQLLWQWMQAPK